MNVPPMQIYVQAMYLCLNRCGTLGKFPVCQQKGRNQPERKKEGGGKKRRNEKKRNISPH